MVKSKLSWARYGIISGLLMVVVGCKKESVHDITIESESAAQRVIVIDGITITIDGKVPFTFVAQPTEERRESTAAEGLGFVGPGQLESSPPRKPAPKIKARSVTINNQKLHLSGGGLMLGKKGYGLVRASDKVEITTSGVAINGQNRGLLP